MCRWTFICEIEWLGSESISPKVIRGIDKSKHRIVYLCLIIAVRVNVKTQKHFKCSFGTVYCTHKLDLVILRYAQIIMHCREREARIIVNPVKCNKIISNKFLSAVVNED